eukprot:2973903-Heterocapsa_arctica.AAC.2
MLRAFESASACDEPMLPRCPCRAATLRFLGASLERPHASTHRLPSPSSPAWPSSSWPGGWTCA